jgi:signal transduction histidine kinase
VPGRIVELRPLAESAVALVEGVARERGVEVQLSSPAESVCVRGDPEALTRALLNLLDNALKYGEGGHPIEVEVAVRADGLAELAVLDRGRGVPEVERQRIFEPFRRIGSELTRDRPGVGLGLALVAKVAAAHGGRAECTPRGGGGSRFALLLPRVEAPLR